MGAPAGASPSGVMSGDVSADSAVIWSRADRAARMIVEWSTTESFADPKRVIGPLTGPEADFTAKVMLRDLPAGQRIVLSRAFRGRGRMGVRAEPVAGQLVTSARDEREVFFAWSGDTCGQGYGTTPDRRGMKTYAALREARPDFFVHSGDTIYADNPIGEGFRFTDGTIWRNLVADEKAKVAETLAEFRAAHRYNLFDEHVRAFNATTSVFAQWDDHEVRNNWYPGQQLLEDRRYQVKDVDVLAARARQSFFDYQPVRPSEGPRHLSGTVRRGPCASCSSSKPPQLPRAEQPKPAAATLAGVGVPRRPATGLAQTSAARQSVRLENHLLGHAPGAAGSGWRRELGSLGEW